MNGNKATGRLTSINHSTSLLSLHSYCVRRLPQSQAADTTASSNGRGGGGGGSRSAPPIPPRANRGLPDNFSRQAENPVTTSTSGTSRYSNTVH